MPVGQFPAVLTGKVSSATLAAMIPTTYRKDTATSRLSTAAVSADPFFSGIALGVGVWEINAILFTAMTTTAANAAVAGFRCNWGFSGTASGLRAVLGIAADASITTASFAQMRCLGSALGTEQTYGVIHTFNQPVREDLVMTVTSAGNLALQWAQVTSNANATILMPGSFVKIRQIE